MKSRRLVCRIVERWDVVRGEPNRPSRIAQSHARRCPDCRARLAQADSLAVALHAEALRERRPVPAGLEDRILAAIGSQARPARPPAQPARSPAWLLAAPVLGAAAVAAALLLPLQPVKPPVVNPVAVHVGAPEPLDWQSFSEPVADALREDPLQREVESVVADARGALRFLALNFLPEPSSVAAGRPRGPQRADG